MYIGISTQTYDLRGSLLFKADIPNTELERMTRRVTRSATLDGGVSITDSGYSHGDRTLNIVARLTEAQMDTLTHIFQNYSEVILAIPEGIFMVNLNSLTNVYGEATIQVLVSEKLAPIAIPAYYCARDDTFRSINRWYLTKLNGGETATPYIKGLTDWECTVDLPDAANTQLTMLYQYLIPVGDFELTLDIADYTPDNDTDGFVISLRLRSSTSTYYSDIATRSTAAGSYQTTKTHKDDAIVVTDITTISDPTEMLMISRVGNELSVNNFANSWQTAYTRDFGVNSGEIAIVEVIAYDTNNRGGSIDIDNLMFRQGCPSTYPKAWTTTCSSTTSSSSSTASTTSSSSSLSTTTSTTSSSSSTSSTASTTSTCSSTSSTVSTTTTSSSSTNTTTSTCSSSSSTTSTASTTSTTQSTTTSSSTSSTASTVSTTSSTASTTTTTTSSSSTSSTASTVSTTSSTTTTTATTTTSSSTASTVSTTSSSSSTASTTSTSSTTLSTTTTVITSSSTTTSTATTTSSTASTVSTTSTSSSTSSTASTASTTHTTTTHTSTSTSSSTSSTSSSTASTVSTVSTTSSTASTISTTSSTESSSSTSSTASTLSTTSSSHTTTSTTSTLSTTTSTSTSTVCTTTTTYLCAYNETFDGLYHWDITKADGSETVTIVAGRMHVDLPDSTDTSVICEYRYLVGAGDFDIQLDIENYNPDNDADGFYVELRVIDDGSYVDWCRTRLQKETAGNPFEVYGRNTINGVNQATDIDNIATPPEKFRVTRVGNVVTNYYHDAGSWHQLVSDDYGARASNLIGITINCYDDSTRGGSVDFDNLVFIDGCPTGAAVAWTSTSTTTTVTTTTTTSPP